ncbi:MAG TPA: immunoglobulin domain-containing protein, partial [Verrucomicrobiae bacterium]|nr:immunoglobulin domain-containing protein [Verrucomicrobiae bacterium]
NYKVEHRSQAGTGDWAALTNIGPLSMSSMVTVSDEVFEPARFYRVKKLPYFLLQPQPVVVAPGGSAQFTVSVAGGEGLTYQWQWNGEDIPGATESTLTVPNVGESDLGDYRVVVTSGSDTIISQSASLMLLIAPFIVEPLQNQTNAAGATVTFTVTVTNTATLPIGYRWRKGAQNVSIQVLNARTSSFSITNIQASDTANYSVIVTNAANISPGFISTARLEVEAP